MKYLSEYDVSDKTVLLRCDFNVPINNNKITDTSKIEKSLKTINYLLERNNKVIILSHFGRIKREEDKKNNSLFIVYEELKKHITLDFIKDNEDIESILNNSNKKCFLLENTRFTDIPSKKESVCDLDLAKYWASYADIFVLDAFASMHRVHSSTAGIGKYLPTYLGFLVEEELKNLEILNNITERSFIVIMGGAKVDDKIKIIEGMLNKCDKLIITGGILNTFLKVMGKNVGNSLVSEDEEVLNAVKDILNKYQNKIIYSNRFVVLNKNIVGEKNIDEIEKEDIIYDNLIVLKEAIKNAKLIFLNGTCGKYEEEDFSYGTKMLLTELKESSSKVIVGGGDSVSAVNHFGFSNDFYYLSSGGGATLEYVAFGKLKALEWINVEN